MAFQTVSRQHQYRHLLRSQRNMANRIRRPHLDLVPRTSYVSVMPERRQHQDPELVIPMTRYVVLSTLCLLPERIRRHLDLVVRRTYYVSVMPESRQHQDPDLVIPTTRYVVQSAFCQRGFDAIWISSFGGLGTSA
jgi:hypothetical protein